MITCPTELSEPLGVDVETLVIDHGHLVQECVTPVITRQFRSDLHTVANYVAGTQALQGDLVELAVSGRKPVSVLSSSDENWMRGVCERAMRAGRVVLFSQHTFSGSGLRHWFGTIALAGVIGDVIDIDALIADYSAWAAAAGRPERSEPISSLLDGLRHHKFEDYVQFSNAELGPQEPWLPGLARTGLLFGYPPQSTAAMMRLAGCSMATTLGRR